MKQNVINQLICQHELTVNPATSLQVTSCFESFQSCE